MTDHYRCAVDSLAAAEGNATLEDGEASLHARIATAHALLHLADTLKERDRVDTDNPIFTGVRDLADYLDNLNPADRAVLADAGGEVYVTAPGTNGMRAVPHRPTHGSVMQFPVRLLEGPKP